MEKERFYPLAITDIDEVHVCVCGIKEDGTWIRPEPLFQSDLDPSNGPYFRYGCLTELYTSPSTAEEKRQEDRDIIRSMQIRISDPLSNEEWRNLIVKNLDLTLDSIFSKGRSAGLLKVTVNEISYGRNLGGGKKVRLIFQDESGASYNFILADRRYKQFVLQHLDDNGELAPQVKQELLSFFPQDNTYFSVGLTRKTSPFPGPYNGCHPLVVGVHTFPDYMHMKTLHDLERR